LRPLARMWFRNRFCYRANTVPFRYIAHQLQREIKNALENSGEKERNSGKNLSLWGTRSFLRRRSSFLRRMRLVGLSEFFL